MTTDRPKSRPYGPSTLNKAVAYIECNPCTEAQNQSSKLTLSLKTSSVNQGIAETPL